MHYLHNLKPNVYLKHLDHSMNFWHYLYVWNCIDAARMAVRQCLQMFSWQGSNSFPSHVSLLWNEGGFRHIICLSGTQFALEERYMERFCYNSMIKKLCHQEELGGILVFKDKVCCREIHQDFSIFIPTSIFCTWT